MLAVPAGDCQVGHQTEKEHAIAVHRLGGTLRWPFHGKSLERPRRGIWILVEQCEVSAINVILLTRLCYILTIVRI